MPEPKEIIAIVAIVVSLVSAAIALFSAYFTLVRGARLQFQVGDTLLITQGLNNTLKLMPDLAIFNGGVAVAIVTKISARLSSKSDSGRDVKLTWTQKLTTEYRPLEGGPANAYERWTRFDGYPSVLFVSKAEAVDQRLGLESTQPYPLQSGDYLLELTLRVEEPAVVFSTVRKRQIQMTKIVRIGSSDEQFFSHYLPKSRVERNRNLEFRYNPDDQCFISGLPPFWQAEFEANDAKPIATTTIFAPDLKKFPENV